MTAARLWCTRCKRFHLNEPVDPDKIAAEMARKIADPIDEEILQELLALGRNSE